MRIIKSVTAALALYLLSTGALPIAAEQLMAATASTTSRGVSGIYEGVFKNTSTKAKGPGQTEMTCEASSEVRVNYVVKMQGKRVLVNAPGGESAFGKVTKRGFKATFKVGNSKQTLKAIKVMPARARFRLNIRNNLGSKARCTYIYKGTLKRY